MPFGERTERKCWILLTWLGIIPGDGHDSITVLIKFVCAWTRACLSALSGNMSARCRAPFSSVTSVVWASGLWLQEARLARSTLAKAEQSLSPDSWHWGSNWSMMNANTLQSYNHTRLALISLMFCWTEKQNMATMKTPECWQPSRVLPSLSVFLPKDIKWRVTAWRRVTSYDMTKWTRTGQPI